MNSKLFSFIKKCPTPFHAVQTLENELNEKGFIKLCESENTPVEKGKSYYITRNMSSIIAFKIPSDDYSGFMISASHCDSPCFSIKENAEVKNGTYVRLSTEKYGGMLLSTWLDRPLSIAGRIICETENGAETRLVDFEECSAVIPNVAIHMNRSANENASYNMAVDMIPLFCDSQSDVDFNSMLSEKAGIEKEKILSSELFLYNNQDGIEWNDYISAPRLDDLQCVFACKEAFLQSENSNCVTVLAVFDNEEVGSSTKQGADSTFLYDTLKRINESFGKSDTDYNCSLADSFMLSCDNAHAVHPNHPELSDSNHSVYMNKGVVIKYNANRKYTSDGVSSAVFKKIAKEAGVPVQIYCNRADIVGGSTLGNISNTHVSLNTVDIGLPQLAMHSAFETAGREDTIFMIKAVSSFYGKRIISEKNGSFIIE